MLVFLFFLILSLVCAEDKKWYKSKCKPSSNHQVSETLDIHYEQGKIKSIVEYRGYSLRNICWAEEDYWVVNVMTVTDYVQSSSFLEATVNVTESYFYVINFDNIMSKNVRCNKAITGHHYHSIINNPINCTYYKHLLFGFEEEYRNITEYAIDIVDGNYVDSERGYEMSLCAEGENSQCPVTTGISRNLWEWGIIPLSFVLISVLYMGIDYLLYARRIHAKRK